MFNLPEKQEIISPQGGWKESTYYVVDVSYNKSNPIFKSIFYTGFLNGKGSGPGGYNELFCAATDNGSTISDVYYMKAIRSIFMGNERRTR